MQEISLVPLASLKAFWETASLDYHNSLMSSPEARHAVEYLTKTRSLSKASAQYFRLGYVGNPSLGHEAYAARLSIPYLTRSGVVTMRFRSLPGDSGPKYLSMPGEEPRLFNTRDLDRRESYVCICEGEFDAITAHQAGLPAVGVAGVNGWRPWFARCFKGYDAVYVLCDHDDKGQGAEFGERIVPQIQGARMVLMPSGHDVNSFVCESGEAGLRELMEIE